VIGRKRVKPVDVPANPDLTIRLLTPADDLAALTALLHRAYGALAARGMRFLASYQSMETTASRI